MYLVSISTIYGKPWIAKLLIIDKRQHHQSYYNEEGTSSKHIRMKTSAYEQSIATPLRQLLS